jgi:hypothetical protein
MRGGVFQYLLLFAFCLPLFLHSSLAFSRLCSQLTQNEYLLVLDPLSARWLRSHRNLLIWATGHAGRLLLGEPKVGFYIPELSREPV